MPALPVIWTMPGIAFGSSTFGKAKSFGEAVGAGDHGGAAGVLVHVGEQVEDLDHHGGARMVDARHADVVVPVGVGLGSLGGVTK